MKKYFMLLAAAATVLAVSCNKEKEQPKVDPTPGTEIEDNTPQPIRFGTNIAEVKSPITKAAIENTGWGAGQTLYVYGFRNASITEDAAYIKNQPATAPATFVNTNPGVRESITVEKSAGHPYYYENNVVYSFYGYYIGNATETAAPAFGTTGLTSTVTIDGTQDIMLADTDKFDDYLYAQDQLGAANVTVSIEKVYSEVSARQGVVPDLKFKHQLARFKFETKYGGNGNFDDINIVKIQMKSVKAGTLTIASADGQGFAATGDWPAHNGEPGDDGKYGFTEGDNSNSFTLMDANGVAATGNPGNGVFAPLGESIMTFPQGLGGTNNDESPVYHLLLTLTQKGRYQANSTTALEEFYVPMDIDFSKVVDAAGAAIPNKYAEAGKMYVIRLVIYGSEKIEMTVSLEDWEYGGETQVDPDQDNRPETTIKVKDKTDQNEITSLPALAIEEEYDHIIATAEYGTTHSPIPSSDIKFASSDKKVATVNNTGKVTAVGAGSCKIYVYVDGSDEYKGALKTVDVTVTGGIAVPATVTVEDGFTIHDATAGTPYQSGEFAINTNAGALSFNCAENTVTVTAGTTDNTKWVVKTTAATPGGVHTITVTSAALAPYGKGTATITVNVAFLDNSLDVANAGTITLAEGAGLSTNDVITVAGQGDLTIEHATDGTETEYKAYFSISANKLAVAKVGDNAIPTGNYTITVKAAGDATHASIEKNITVTIQ